ncbi:tetratricopeptide repeat protein [Pedobacter punctiformis]|uniref:Tetratricopeptide repeat protein n=1 Tax=Pedobacter punctiformis TaxID=3004097 RepID=A0ABT4L8B7_9SPHI|nr:tetratricopeptide repeat protein [Pedobacter sp. HCMS5-2]MCZ4244161.1 tetratricopeptide repeat protein [Pedobacter sp. HCMS5-2]
MSSFLFRANSVYAQYRISQIDSLLQGVNQSHNIEERVQLINKAYRISKAANYNEGTIKSLILLAGESFNTGKYEDVLKLTAKADTLTVKVNDALYPTQILILKSQVYSKLGFYTYGKQALFGAISVAKRIKERDQQHNSLGIIYASLGSNIQMSNGDKDSAFYFIRKSYSEFIQIRDSVKYSKGLNLALYNLGQVFENHKQYDSAEVYYKKATLIKDNNNITAAAFNSLGKLYYQQKKYSTAMAYYKQAEDVSIKLKNIYQLKKTYTGLSQIFDRLNDNKKATEYLQLSNKLGDSINKIEKASVKAPLSNIVGHKEETIEKNKKRTRWIISVSSILLLIVISLIFLYRYRLKKERKISEIRINELIKKIDENREYRSPQKIEELKEVVQLAIQNNPSFYLKFNDFDPDFGKKLNNLAPNLVATEVEFCAMLRLNFETKEIARYTKSSVRAVESKKYRIRKKLSIPTDQDTYLWIANI